MKVVKLLFEQKTFPTVILLCNNDSVDDPYRNIHVFLTLVFIFV